MILTENKNIYKMTIKFNNKNEEMVKKILYKIDSISKKKRLNSKFFIEEQSIIIKSVGNPNDFANLGSIIFSLKKQDWFKDNIVEWLFYDTENGVEDLMSHYRMK